MFIRDEGRRISKAMAVSAAGGEGVEAGGGEGADAGGDASDVAQSQGEGVGEAARRPVEPVGAPGAMEDDILMELVGQDYGMMALLRNDKFKGLIVLLRNVPPNEWVSEVARAYPDDDEVKGMMGQVGKLMRMIDYYQAKKLKK
ncbi:unnamed protein product [Pylaiella littoralis]